MPQFPARRKSDLKPLFQRAFSFPVYEYPATITLPLPIEESSMIPITTASWFVKVPKDHVRIGISRGTPRGQSGFRTYRRLAPGPWFKSVQPGEYLQRFDEEVLAPLDAFQVMEDLTKMTEGRPAVLLCYESAPKIHAGELWCHRHLVAAWLERNLGLEVPELDFPGLDRFALLRKRGLAR